MPAMTRTELMANVVIPRLEADSALITALGGEHIYMAQSSLPVIIPSVAWTVLREQSLENYWRIEVQFDFWTNTTTQADTVRSRLRVLLHTDRRRQLGGVDMATLYLEGRMLGVPELVIQKWPGVIHEMARFRFEPVRARYST